MTETVEPKFEIGDVVSLNSNDNETPMTVKVLMKKLNPRTAKNDLFYGIIKCSWFEKGTYKEEQFHQDMLQSVVKE